LPFGLLPVVRRSVAKPSRSNRAPAFSGGKSDFSLLVVLLDIYLVVKALTLTLFVTRVIADDHDATVTTNNLALVADLLDAWVNLHVFYFY
jgi:hypothetical protein